MKPFKYWFATGSQHLYGSETLDQVQEHSRQIVEGLNQSGHLPFEVVLKPVLTNSDAIRRLIIDANGDDLCAGIITWMHTFSPAKMWIAGLTRLAKPLLHLHTQFNRDIPWDSIDMDFMNLNQSAHGDREFGFIGARLGVTRKVVVGYWEEEGVQKRIGGWMSTAAAYSESQNLKVARFGDNMREVAVTDGNKVSAQAQLGWSINGYGVGDLVEVVNNVSEGDINSLFEEYHDLYELSAEAKQPGAVRDSILEQARIELGLKKFLQDGEFGAFTTTFEDLHGLKQLPGLAVQRLMAQGYGFGGEGDWKTAALTRLMKLMANNVDTSFMEDYTYHLEPGNELNLGSHMLEVCPTIAVNKPRIDVQPLGIGGKADPARLIFEGKPGKALVASIIELGGRYRLIINQIQAVENKKQMPKLPVASVLWKPEPSLEVSAEAWIHAGGAHHTVLSYAVTTEQLLDYAELTGIEAVVIDNNTNIRQFRQELQWNELYWRNK
ncbi:L-arabinose isomerase (plasmid) [Paenibacillus sp. IHB B 3084]|uniref:L-arabinose isomerase n=1 Tax=Paenibacillus sp. IHB B 3084 TaxID=867076 RepID=UPI000720AD9E|nr:L-arabinose isomerase [Paenibacillus sp. IHB B 3084]ALP39243.1 L-arabinose isomerase [Paenibacillus sp. IHB B 3084]